MESKEALRYKVQEKLPREDQICSKDQRKGVDCQPTALDNLSGASIK